MIDAAGSFGAKVYYGDGTRLDLLRQAGAGEAQLILFCIDGDVIDADLLGGVAAAFPSARVFVRAYDRRSLLKMAGASVAGTVREVLESAVCMARLALADLGVDEDELARTERIYRARDAERLAAQEETGDLRAKIERMIVEPIAAPTAVRG